MTPLSIAVLAFALITGAGFLGLALRPDETHRAEPVRDMVRFTQGIVASIAALVLGLLVAGATDHYRSQSEQVRRMAAEVIVLDRALTQFGLDAAEARRSLHRSIEHTIDEIWATEARRLTMPPHSVSWAEAHWLADDTRHRAHRAPQRLAAQSVQIEEAP